MQPHIRHTRGGVKFFQVRAQGRRNGFDCLFLALKARSCDCMR